MDRHTFGLSGRPGVVLAHAGVSGLYPPNSKEALELAIDSGFGVEADFRMTADEVLVLWHDSLIDGHPIEKRTYEQLLHYHPELMRARWLLRRAPIDTVLVCELKYEGVVAAPGPLEEIVLEELGAVGRLEGDTTVVSSLSPASMRECQRLAPQLPRLQILDGMPPSQVVDLTVVGEILTLVRTHAAGIVPSVNDFFRAPPLPWVEMAQVDGLGVFPYPPRSTPTTAQHRAGVEAMIAAGTDGGHFDFPWMYGYATGSQRMRPFEAMAAFLAAQRRVSAALPEPEPATHRTLGRLAALMIRCGGGKNMSIADLRAAINGPIGGALRESCEQLLVLRTLGE